jgi:hypothetical protein
METINFSFAQVRVDRLPEHRNRYNKYGSPIWNLSEYLEKAQQIKALVQGFYETEEIKESLTFGRITNKKSKILKVSKLEELGQAGLRGIRESTPNWDWPCNVFTDEFIDFSVSPSEEGDTSTMLSLYLGRSYDCGIYWASHYEYFPLFFNGTAVPNDLYKSFKQTFCKRFSILRRLNYNSLWNDMDTEDFASFEAKFF